MNKEDKFELYYRAKEAYYNGEEIMSDLEFDQLEKELGLENKSEVGARHNPKYTVQHPMIMGSLSKVQIHEDSNGKIAWQKYFDDAVRYFGNNELIITPKYDGCSFEVETNDGKLVSISTRGDGEYGKDLMKHLEAKIPTILVECDRLHRIYRGEVLVKKEIFEQKYAEQFTNPRSFVSGVLNSDYSEDEEFQSRLNDLNIVIYDLREEFDDKWHDQDWNVINFNTTNKIKSYNVLPSFYIEHAKLDTAEKFQEAYYWFLKYRKECEYALDGIVIKPLAKFRINNMTDHRPKDCVAIKFVPMLQETEVVDIKWNVAKTGELIPIIYVNPVEMDGRMVQKCSGSNYGNLISKKVSIGSKIVMSLAGDIIPFLYKVTDTTQFDINKLNVPEESTVDGIHLMKRMSDEEIKKNSFLYSAISLNIPNIGLETAKKIFEYICSQNDDSTFEFFGEESKVEIVDSILKVKPADIYIGVGSGRAGQKAKKSFEDVIKKLTLVDVIKSCSFNSCGQKVAEQCADYLMYGKADFSHLAEKGYSWCFDSNSPEYLKVVDIIHYLGKEIGDFIPTEEEQQGLDERIPIIMTGEPNTCSTKGEFLRLHPEYRNTTSWKEVQIVFTNSMDSTTGKMKKAIEKGIEIRLY